MYAQQQRYQKQEMTENEHYMKMMHDRLTEQERNQVKFMRDLNTIHSSMNEHVNKQEWAGRENYNQKYAL